MKLLNVNNGKVIFEFECNTIEELLIEAHKNDVSLRHADLRNVNLNGAGLRNADLRDVNLRGASLRGIVLCDVNLRGAVLCGVDLYDADLYRADLYGTDLYGANLRSTNLRGTYLFESKNIRSFQCGDSNRIIYAVKHETKVMFQIGCFWGDKKEAVELIRNDYGLDSYYEKLVNIYNDMLGETS